METPNQKKKRNIIMIAAIIVMVIAAVLSVIAIKCGWFAGNSEQLKAKQVIGVVFLERDGISFELNEDEAVYDGDIIRTEEKASVILACGESEYKIPESTEAEISFENGKTQMRFIAKGTDPETEETTTKETTETVSTETSVVSTTESHESESQSETQVTTQAETQPPTSQQEETQTVTISIVCNTILNNWDELKKEKQGYVPADGIILNAVQVSFTEGESALSVIIRTCEMYGIQIEYASNGYIQGIGHLYEFDCGYESGWEYKVNGVFPNYGTGSYRLNDGDVMVLAYTCKGYGADLQ